MNPLKPESIMPAVRGEPDLFSISELFHENTKMLDCEIQIGNKFLDEEKRAGYDALLEEIYRRVNQSYKSYPHAVKIALPKNFSLGKTSIGEILTTRRTARSFSEEPLSIDELSKLLHYSYGITGEAPETFSDGTYQKLRASPSGGGLYPLEIYLVIFNVENVENGLYHYFVKEHCIELISAGDYRPFMSECVLFKDIVDKAAVMFIVTAVFLRHKFKYGERGYRYTLLDAGHFGQNLYLTATALKLGCVAVCGFIDDKIDSFLNVDGVNESTVYTLCVGRPMKEVKKGSLKNF